MKRASTVIALAILATHTSAHENEVSITREGGQICIASNGVPNHDIGTFPTRGDPNRFSVQNLRYCFDAAPELTGWVERRVPVSGITITGIPIRPGTAEFYDPRGRAGFSRNPASGWRIEAMGTGVNMGLDSQNAHVDERGLYHYHGVSQALVRSLTDNQIGYAADGFPIYYAPGQAESSYQLKSGRRPTAPYGRYNGKFVEDWEYVAGSGNLDECNGTMVNGSYAYFATDTYPFFPRCFKGTVSRDFRRP